MKFRQKGILKYLIFGSEGTILIFLLYYYLLFLVLGFLLIFIIYFQIY